MTNPCSSSKEASSGDAAAHAQLSDLEMVRLCAEAMQLRVDSESGNCALWCIERVSAAGHDEGVDRPFLYCPLHNDAQAMALVKRFRPNFTWMHDGAVGVTVTFENPAEFTFHDYYAENADLNRAIVECVAKMQRQVRTRPQENVEAK